MIHSMSGGVLDEWGTYTFAKVVFDGGDGKPYWYVAEFEVDEGDKVLAPFGGGNVGKPTTVIKVERGVSGQVSPVPVRRAKRLISKL